MNFGSLEYPDITQTTTVLWTTAVCNLVAGYHLPERRSIYCTIIFMRVAPQLQTGQSFSEIRQVELLAQDADSSYIAATIT